MARDRLTIALPKGKLFDPSVRLLQKVGLPWEELLEDTRQLVFDYEDRELVGYAIRY
ncbi:MAG: ATP phosphoribosyltransferase, partial [Syntrophomonadaceae bacterium]|nr:ATP phosphoribosyltransferase [Syntrophomonadaceae bacterium]